MQVCFPNHGFKGSLSSGYSSAGCCSYLSNKPSHQGIVSENYFTRSARLIRLDDLQRRVENHCPDHRRRGVNCTDPAENRSLYHCTQYYKGITDCSLNHSTSGSLPQWLFYRGQTVKCPAATASITDFNSAPPINGSDAPALRNDYVYSTPKHDSAS